MKPFVIAVLAVTFASASGCALFRHKKHGRPQLPPAAGIEAQFRGRWIDQRVHDLMTAKPPPSEAEARKKAEAEFAKQYPYVDIPKPGAKH